MNALAETEAGVYTLDAETGEIVDFAPGATLDVRPPPAVNLPRVIAAAAAGSTVVVVVDARPPMLVSHDAGVTWRDSGRGLPRGTAVAIAEANPDAVLFAAGERLWVSHDGARFWQAVPAELPERVVGLDWLM